MLKTALNSARKVTKNRQSLALVTTLEVYRFKLPYLTVKSKGLGFRRSREMKKMGNFLDKNYKITNGRKLRASESTSECKLAPVSKY